MNSEFLIYGSYGYTGELVVRYALEQGLKPVLAGRSGEKLRAQAEPLGLEARVFGLDDAAAVDAGLAGMGVVIHCAGPFSRTAKAMAEACMRTGTHYLDITGEIEVFERLAGMDEKAKAAGVMLMPGVGFDVVPTDCLAAHLKGLMPDATHLTLAFMGSGGLSHGTATTMTENFHRGGAIRRDGKIVPVPAAYETREIDFGQTKTMCMTIPWGDVSTAYRSTGIPNIKVFMAAPAGLRRGALISRYIGPLLSWGPVQKLMLSRIREGGPSDKSRAKGFSLLWGEVKNASGETLVSRLKTVDGYTLTALTSLLIARKVLAGNAPAGFQTPSMAYGADLILEVEGTTRED